MAEAVSTALRERLTVWSAVGWLLVIATWYVLFDTSPAQMAVSLSMGAVVGVADLLADAYDLRSAVQSLALGVMVVVASAGLAAFDGGPAAVWGVIVVVGAWIAVDAVQTIRHEGIDSPSATEDERDGREVYLEYVASEVRETLRERPMTQLELRDALDADDDAIDRAVDRLEERGAVTREGSELRVPSDDPSVATRFRRTVSGAAGRLARPVTIGRDDDRESGT